MNRPAEAPDERMFDAPWQAQTFALVLALHDRGLFTWGEWSAALSAESKRVSAGEAGYEAWLGALETLLVSLDVTTVTGLHAWRDAWDSAARATPHGRPIAVVAPDVA